MTLNIFHTGDIHYAPSTLDQVNRCFAAACREAIRRNCHLALLNGDIFDHYVPLHSPVVDAVCRQVKYLALHMPVLITQGTFSHDVPGSLDVFRSVGGKHPIRVADRITQLLLVYDGAGFIFIDTRDWAFGTDELCEMMTDASHDVLALISILPTVNKAHIAAIEGGDNAPARVGDYVQDILTGWEPSHTLARQHGIPSLIASHGTLHESQSEHGVPMAGFDNEYTGGALFASNATAVCLNHIHLHQSLEREGRRIAYSGSLARLHYGEIGPKVALYWDIDAETAEFEAVEMPARITLDLDYGDNRPDLDDIRRRTAELAPDTHIRVRYAIETEARHTVDRRQIEDILKAAGAAGWKIEPRIVPVERTRAAGIGQAANLSDQFRHWCKVTGLGDDAEALIERLALLEAEGSTEAIVEQLAVENQLSKEQAA